MRRFNLSYSRYLLKNLLKNLLMFLMPAVINRVRRTTGTGSSQLDRNIVELTSYCRGVFEKYCRHIDTTGVLTASRDKTVVELGPGDTIGTALYFLAHGAARVICVDRFKLATDSSKNTLIARQVISTLSEPQQHLLQTILCFDDCGNVRLNPSRLQHLYSRNEHIALEYESADIIVSNAVLEHVQDLDALFSSMQRILKPGGIMVHAADLKSHGLHHTTALDFLTIPETLWKCMTFYRGAPNRKRKTYYENLLERHGFEITFFKVTSRIPREEIAAFQNGYPYCAANYSEEDLSCGGFLFAAKKR